MTLQRSQGNPWTESGETVAQRPGSQIDVSISQPFQKELSQEWLRAVAESALLVALPDGPPVQVGLLVADDATVRQLNREYRGLDEATDVLSFSPSHSGQWEGEGDALQDRFEAPGGPNANPFVLPPGELPPLGEVIISYPQARRQALEQRQPVDREVALLIVHGVLHLAGHDHLEPPETARMQAMERTALASVFHGRT